MKLYFRELGEGKPLLILHGLLGSSDNWATLGRKFAETHRVFLIDLRNHGRSPHSEEFSYALMADDIGEFLQQQGLASATLLGHSMGGKAAMFFALNYADQVEKLLVVDATLRAADPRQFQEIFAALSSVNPATFTSRREADEQLATAIPDPVMRAFLLKNLRRDGAHAYAWKMNLPVLYKALEAISGGVEGGTPYHRPTLFIRGEKSPYISAQDQPLIRRWFPAARVETVAGAGHWVHADAPEEFYKVAVRFLAE